MSPVCERRICIISGPSGAGKTTIYKRLLAEHDWLAYSVSATTRPPRPDEVDGRDYHFVSQVEFERMLAADAFAEHALVHGNNYGTLKSELEEKTCGDRICILDIDIQGAARLRGLYPGALKIFIQPPDVKALECRLLGRSTESEDVRRTRLANAIRELEDARFFDYCVTNDCFEQAYSKVREIIARHKKELE